VPADHLVLASRSPQRRHILETLGVPFTVRPVDVVEEQTGAPVAVASENALRQMTETIPEMLWSATAAGAIDYCNTRFLDYTGFPPDKVMGDGWRPVGTVAGASNVAGWLADRLTR